MNKIVNATRTTKQFVRDHRVVIAVAATSAFWIGLQRGGMATMSDFIAERGLDADFNTYLDAK